ncbi:MAG: polysaccharide deacetylase family protein [Gemmatimonadaceae bacterium]
MMTSKYFVTMLYHDVDEPSNFDATGFQGALADTYKLKTSDFISHLESISSARDDAPVLIDTALPNVGRRAPWMITFDDGGTSALHPTADLLESRGWRGHFFITTGSTGKAGFLNADGVRELRARGHLIGAHSVTHPLRMADLDDASLLREWRDCRDTLESILNERVVVGSVPGGLYSDRVAKAAGVAGLRVLFNSEPTRKVRQVSDVTVIGRYSFKASSPASQVESLASESPVARTAQWVLWNSKTTLKTLSPKGFQAISRLVTRVRGQRAERDS